MRKGRFIIGIIFIIFNLIYIFVSDLLLFDFKNQLINLYDTLFASIFIPVVLFIIGIGFIYFSLEIRNPKAKYFKDRMGKQCAKCGQTISELSTKCPYCGNIQI